MINVPAQIISLSTKHNFVKEAIEHEIEIAILGHKHHVVVSEEFVAHLDAALAQTDVGPKERHSYDNDEEFRLGSVHERERDPGDYTDEEIRQL